MSMEGQFPSEEAVQVAARSIANEFHAPYDGGVDGYPPEYWDAIARSALICAASFFSPERCGGGIVETTAGEVRVGDEGEVARAIETVKAAGLLVVKAHEYPLPTDATTPESERWAELEKWAKQKRG